MRDAMQTVTARNVLEEIQQNAQDPNRHLDSNREEEENDDSELTEMERQIVAKYLNELEGSEEESASPGQCDLNNNCHESAIARDMGQGKSAETDKEKMDEDKENKRVRVFPTSAPKEELAAMSLFRRHFPQLSRRTSLDSTTGDSAEDLVSACPQLVNYLKQQAIAAATTSAQSSAPHDKDSSLSAAVASQCSVSPSQYSAPTVSPCSSTAAVPISTTNADASRCSSTTNRRAEVKMDTDISMASKKKDKTVKRRANYSVWVGVTSCIWGLLFYLMKTYL